MKTYSSMIAALVDLTTCIEVFLVTKIPKGHEPKLVTEPDPGEPTDVVTTKELIDRINNTTSSGGFVEWYAVESDSAAVAVIAVVYEDLGGVAVSSLVIGTLT